MDYWCYHLDDLPPTCGIHRDHWSLPSYGAEPAASNGQSVAVTFQVLTQTPVTAPQIDTAMPLPTAVAQVVQQAQPPTAMAFLDTPSRYFNGRDPGDIIGLRGVFFRALAADEALWETLLSAGLPLWALSHVIYGSGDVFLSLMYGNFLCATEQIALPTGWSEDRFGITWQDGPSYEVFDRHGFVLATGTGAGAWQDRGDEGLVRVRWQHDSGAYAWSQPRLVAPHARQNAGHNRGQDQPAFEAGRNS